MALAPMLVGAVNPRLMQYGSIAWLLALVILVLNYALVAGLGVVLRGTTCSTAVDGPNVQLLQRFEDVKSQVAEFLYAKRADGTVTTNGGTNVTTEVNVCIMKAREFYVPSAAVGQDQILDGTECWPIIDCVGASYDANQPNSMANLPCRPPGTAYNMNDITADDPPMQWCNDEAYLTADDWKKIGRGIVTAADVKDRRNIWAEKVLKPTNLNPPNTGVLRVCASDSRGTTRTRDTWLAYTYAVSTTKTTVTCPTYLEVFGIALGYLTQIEILVTLVILLLIHALGCTPKNVSVMDSAKTAMSA